MIIHVGKQPPPLTPAASLCPAFRRAARYNVARFFFRRRSRVFFSSFLNNPARERNLHKRALLLRNIGHFSTIPSAHTSSSIRPLSPRQRLSIAVLANDACRASRPTPNIHLLATPLRSLRSREREREARPREIARGARDPLQLRYPSFRFNDSFLSLPFY